MHLLPDIAIGHTARLVLFDLEFHAHPSESSFRLGPTTQRFVQVTPEWCDRDAVLLMADVELYCARENDRCFVWYDGVRWPDTDVESKRFSHGDHIRIALPPTDRFVCSTPQMVRWTQSGFNDEEILHFTAEHEAAAGYSPSLLDQDEVRALATPHLEQLEVENDSFQAMQHSTVLLTTHGTNISPTSDSGESVIPEDWIIDLQRIVEQHEVQCNIAQQDEFLVSVYTWLLDHQDRKTCHEPKIAILGGDPSEWYEDILQPWRYYIAKEEQIFLDLVQPRTPRADVEEHIAHILLTKRSTALSSTLLSLEFVDPLQRSVVVRYATVLPRHCTVQDLSDANSFFANLPFSRLVWTHPEVKEEDHVFETRNGMGIIIKVLPERVASPTPSDHTNEPLQPLSDVTNLMQTRDILGKTCLQKFSADADEIQPLCSFTDEFLEAVAAHRDAEQMEPPMHLIPDPRSIDAQPESIRDLWERFTDAQAASPIASGNVQRVESWFLNHRSFTRCHHPRITLLYEDFLVWHQALVNTWQDKLEGQEDISFAIVHPLPEDAASGIIAQLIVTQHAMPEFRSSVLSVYDTDPDIERSPRTFAVVLPQHLDLESLLRFLNLLSDCTPPDRRNHCTLWFGRIPIASHTILNVHMGHAFRLLVSRGEPVAIAQLLAMSSSQLREVLQRSRLTEIFVRPPDPSFLPAAQNESERIPFQLELPMDRRPDWILSLESLYDRHHIVEDIEV